METISTELHPGVKTMQNRIISDRTVRFAGGEAGVVGDGDGVAQVFLPGFVLGHELFVGGEFFIQPMGRAMADRLRVSVMLLAAE